MPCTRIILLSTERAPSREELQTSERCVGDVFLSPLELEYGGYEIVTGTGKMAARWMVPDEKWDRALDFVESYALEGYDVQLHAQVDLNPSQNKTKTSTTSRRFA